MNVIRMPRTFSTQTIEQAFEDFLLSKTAENCTAATIKHYREALHPFFSFVGSNKDVCVITTPLIRDYQVHLRNKGLAEKTIHTYCTALRVFVKYLTAQGFIHNVTITMPKLTEHIKEGYSQEELQKLLVKPNLQKCSFSEYRNWVMVNYFYGTGQRLSTVINIKNKDLNLAEETVHLTHLKNRRTARLPLSPSLVRILREYTSIRGGGPDDYLFCTKDGRQLSAATTQTAIRTYNLSRGVEKTSIHLFRHSFASNYLDNGGDIFHLKKLMTHSNLKVTELYLGSYIKDVQKNYESLNPLERTIKKNIDMKRGKRA